MTEYTDEATARQLEALWNSITRGIDYAEAILERSRQVEAEIIRHSQTIESRASQAKTTKLEIAEIAQQVQQLQVTVEEIQTAAQCNDGAPVVASVSSHEIGILQLQDARAEFAEFQTHLQQSNQQMELEAEQKFQALRVEASRVEDRLTLMQQRVNEINDATATAHSVLAKQAMAQVKAVEQRVKLHEDQVLSQLRSLVEAMLVEGQAGLETLRRELREGREVLSQLQSSEQQLQIGIGAASRILQELLQADSALQKAASRVEQRSLEVASMTQQVRADYEAIQSAREISTADASQVRILDLVSEQRGEIERLNKQLRDSQGDLGQRLQSIVQSQQHLRNWLLGVTFGVTLALALGIAMVEWR